MSADLDLRDQLREVARRRDTITYQPIANALGVDLDQDSERARLGRILGDISRAEHADGRPLLSAVVVLGSSNVPGNGFFDLARELGVHSGEDDLAFFATELRRVHDHWSRQPRGPTASSTSSAQGRSAAPREGSLVSHPIHGVGVVEFWKDSFPAARVRFKGGTVKVAKEELCVAGQQPPSPPPPPSPGAGPSPASSPTLRRHSYDSSSMAGWRSYPVRVQIKRLSDCCRAPMLLVQSMSGGFVRPNCSKCGERDTLSLSELVELPLWVRCPECRERMVAGHVPDNRGELRNYGFSCHKCAVFIWLADLLPHWEDL